MVVRLRYQIHDFRSDSRYMVAPLFQSPIAREWDSEILAKPVVMCFAVFEVAGPNRFSIIGTSEEVHYPTN